MSKWASLTWNDLDEWAGSRTVSRGTAYAKNGSVQDLAISANGRLLATVIGGEEYVVSVWRAEKRSNKSAALHSACTCPVGQSGCKHAVAVVAAYLEMLKRKHAVPAADPDDPRWLELDTDTADGLDLDNELENATVSRHASSIRRGKQEVLNDKIRHHIQSKSQKELADLVWTLTQRFPEIYQELHDRVALGEGEVDRLVTEARKELRRVTSDPGWRNDWNNSGYTPD